MHQLPYFMVMHINNIEIFISYFLLIILFLLLLLHGDIESNRGPKKKKQTYFSLCHWNVNSLVAHIALLAAYNSVYRYDIICISAESSLDLTISDDDNIFFTWRDVILLYQTTSWFDDFLSNFEKL